jgi:hypothetical protein
MSGDSIALCAGFISEYTELTLNRPDNCPVATWEIDQVTGKPA